MDAKTPQEDRAAERQANGKTDRDRKSDKFRTDEGSGDNRGDTERKARPKSSLWQQARQHPWLVAGAAVAIIVILIAVLLWWLHARHFESTDDAFIDTRTATIAPQVAGSVSAVLVTDNQVVQAGDVLLTLDSGPFRAQLAQAQAQVDQARANVANIDAQVSGQQTRIEAAQKQSAQANAALVFAQQEFNRAQDLAKTGYGTVQQAQQTSSNLKQAEAAFSAAEENATGTIKQLAVLRTQREAAAAQVESARAQQTIAQTNVGYTTLTAPTGGRVTKLTAALGGYVAPGQALMMFVPHDVWITANFKETQLVDMRRGQPVDITIDAYPNRDFHGHVDSIQAGSGTAFSLLPAENATGNYVKVVQRIPVKVVFDEPPPVELGPGMSAVPTVRVR